MSEAERLARFLNSNARSKEDYEAADELRRLSVESEIRRLALQDEMQKNKRLTAELESLKKAMGEPVACVQHFKGDKGRLFFFDEVSPPPGSNAYVDDVTWTLLCAIQKDKP